MRHEVFHRDRVRIDVAIAFGMCPSRMRHVQNTASTRLNTQIWGLIINSPRSNRDVFGRQVTYFAADVCEKKLFIAVILKNMKKGTVRVLHSKQARTLFQTLPGNVVQYPTAVPVTGKKKKILPKWYVSLGHTVDYSSHSLCTSCSCSISQVTLSGGRRRRPERRLPRWLC